MTPDDDNESSSMLDDQDDDDNELLNAALAYAALGYPVFPLTRDKVPYANTHGHLDATTDPDKIRKMWDRHPSANIGIRPPGNEFDDVPCVVVDIDPKHGGVKTLDKAARDGGPSALSPLAIDAQRWMPLRDELQR